MAKTKFTAQKLARLEASTRLIKGTNRLLYFTTAVAFGLLIVATAVPHKRENDRLQAQLHKVKAREQATLDIKEHRQIELHALRNDLSFLEVKARDRLNYYRQGEKVLRFDRDQ